MAEAINLSTAGVHMYYAVETSENVRPTSGYVDLVGVKSTPSLNPSPNTLDATTLNEEEWIIYIQGLKDLGGALEFTFNLTQSLMELWETLMTAFNTAKASGLSCWFLIDVPRTNSRILL